MASFVMLGIRRDHARHRLVPRGEAVPGSRAPVVVAVVARRRVDQDVQAQLAPGQRPDLHLVE
ncbi:MAG TPA: hypothetical protein VFY52_02730, partial [Thermoleophilaceae bacterium]|nr:hypothetical protein [Thermoleophilaceae bacterium]